MKKLLIPLLFLMVLAGEGYAASNEITTTGGMITTNGNYIIHTFTGNGTFGVNGVVKLCEVLCVGGGAGGGGCAGGGGGAGGFLSNGVYLVTNGTLAIIGSGGNGGAGTGNGSSGIDSTFGTNSATGGGGGGGNGLNGLNGGSGGGGGKGTGKIGGNGILGQGNDGGDSGYLAGPGGGGGGNAVGANGIDGQSGNGGNGNVSSISGSLVTYAGGGGGGGFAGAGADLPGSGGTGGGGGGATSGTTQAQSGIANTGGGGGGGGQTAFTTDWTDGASGGSGIVIVRYDDSFNLFKAINPVPADASTDADLGGVELQFADGGGATNYHLYFGLADSISNVYSGIATNWSTGALEKGKTYYWRVDSENSSARITGDTWSFHSLFYVTPHRVFSVIDNTRIFGRQGNRIWGK